MMGKLFGLLGHPVGHSMSPAMHNDQFNQLGLSHYYQAFDVHPDRLGQAVNGIRALGISGFNVTIPHKVTIMEYLDEIDEEAKAIGAVNTVLNQHGKLVGFNTDGRGYVQSLQKVAGDALDKRILIIGAGGAAKGIYISLAVMGAKNIDLTNRTLEKAQELNRFCKHDLQSKVRSIEEAEKMLSHYDIIINTTSVGMSPYVEAVPLSLDHLKKGTIVSDIIYNPLETKWLSIAKHKGAIIHNGIGMFVAQGALAFEIWTGKKPDFEKMKLIVIEQLGG